MSGAAAVEDWVDVVAVRGRPGTTVAAPAAAAAGTTGVGRATGSGAPGAGAARITGTGRGTAPGDTRPMAAAGTTPGILTPVTTPPTGGA